MHVQAMKYLGVHIYSGDSCVTSAICRQCNYIKIMELHNPSAQQGISFKSISKVFNEDTKHVHVKLSIYI